MPRSSLAQVFRGNSLRSRCARSSVILAAGSFAAKFLGFGSKVVLARLLLPRDMGLMVMILTITYFFECLTEVGIKQSVIQHRNGSEYRYANTAWWFQAIRGIGLYAVAFLAAPFVCRFYFQTKAEIMDAHSIWELVWLVRVAFLGMIFNGVVSPQAHILEKDFKFGKAVLITHGGFILGSLITIVLAFILRNVWAIVIGYTSTGIFRCLVSYILCPFKPSISYDRESWRDITRFARGMFGLPIMTYLAFGIDVLVGGKMVGASLMGYYGMAKVLALVPRDLFARIINPVLFSAYAEKQHEKPALCRVTLEVTRAFVLVFVPAIAVVTFCGGTVLRFVYGPEYSVMAVPFGLLNVYVLCLVAGNVFACIFFGLGEPGKHRTFVTFRALLATMLMYPAIKYFGLSGAAGAVLIANLVALSVQIRVAQQMIGFRLRDYLRAWLPGILGALPVLAATQGTIHAFPGRPIAHLLSGTAMCAAVVIAGTFYMKSRRIVSTPCAEDVKCKQPVDCKWI